LLQAQLKDLRAAVDPSRLQADNAQLRRQASESIEHDLDSWVAAQDQKRPFYAIVDKMVTTVVCQDKVDPELRGRVVARLVAFLALGKWFALTSTAHGQARVLADRPAAQFLSDDDPRVVQHMEAVFKCGPLHTVALPALSQYFDDLPEHAGATIRAWVEQGDYWRLKELVGETSSLAHATAVLAMLHTAQRPHNARLVNQWATTFVPLAQRQGHATVEAWIRSCQATTAGPGCSLKTCCLP